MIESFPYIPERAFLFLPKEEEIFTFKNQVTHRVIFDGGVTFTPFEKQKLAGFHEQIKNQSKNRSLSFLSDSLILRFLQATKFEYDDCAKELRKYKKWEEGVFPLRSTEFIENILRKGLFYMVGRDVNYRPILVVNVAKIIEEDLQEKVFYEVAGYFFSYILQNCMIEGQVQNWITIIDLGKIGLFSLGGTIIDVISFLSKNFRCRLFSSFLVNCPGSIAFLFGIAKKAMTEDQINKIKLQEQAELPKEAFSYIFKGQIEKKYGGLHENYTQYWPLKLIERNQSKEQLSRLISVEDYYNIYMKGLLKQRKIKKTLLEQGLIKKKQHDLKEQKLKKSLYEQKRTVQQQLKRQKMERQYKILEQGLFQDSVPDISAYFMPINLNELFLLQ